MDIAPDGTFCKKFKASYPIRDLFWTTEAKTQFNYIPFFARPGETIDITVRIHEDGWYDYTFNSGSSHDVERWLRFSNEYIDVFRPLYSFKGRLEEGNKLAESIFQEALYRLRTESRRYKYTPIEMQLALADLQANFVENYLSYVDNYAQTLVKRQSAAARELCIPVNAQSHSVCQLCQKPPVQGAYGRERRHGGKF